MGILGGIDIMVADILGKRMVAVMIDHMINCMIILIPIFIPCFLIGDPALVFDHFGLILGIEAFLISTKDLIFKNASIGKKALNLKVVTNNNEVPKKSQLIIRNITLLIWPIDFLVLLITKRRIGEIITKTKVIEVNN